MHVDTRHLLALTLTLALAPFAATHPLAGKSLDDIDALLSPQPQSARESKTAGAVPGGQDAAQRAREDFREQHAAEHGVKPAKNCAAKTRRPFRGFTNKRVLEDGDAAPQRDARRLATIVEDARGEEEAEALGPLNPWARPTVELGFGTFSRCTALRGLVLTRGTGYNKGSKYDNRYGHLRAYDRTIDIERLEDFAAGLADDTVAQDG